MSDPAPVLDLIEAFRRSKTLFAAVQLGIFDGERPPGVAIDRLLDACVALGLLERRGPTFVNAPVADAYLRRSSPRTLAGYIRYSNAALYPMWGHLESAVLEGTNRWHETFGGERGAIFSHFFRTDERKRDFLAGMHGMGMLSSPAVVAAFDLSPFRRFVDLGGGTGHLAQAVRERYPRIDAVLFDLPEVIAVAREYVGDGVTLVAGDFFRDPLPAGDLYGLSRILHDWGEETIRVLLARIRAALPPGGGLLIAEMLLDEDRRGPIRAHMQSLNMLVATEGRERTLGEYAALLSDAGFQDVRGAVTGTVLDAVLART
jgi:acetylserotonin N-methyltransferase